MCGKRTQISRKSFFLSVFDFAVTATKMVTRYTYFIVLTVTSAWYGSQGSGTKRLLPADEGDGPGVWGGRAGSALYPRDTETRERRTLDGIWNFRLSPADPEYGFKNNWYKTDLSKTGPVIPMPVPASYNDITEEAAIRDHVGLVWYDRRFFVPETWRKAEFRVWLRFGSIHYAAQVWVNGIPTMHHEIGHLPFEREVTQHVNFGADNLVTVACDNTLLADTVPQGSVSSVFIGGQMRLQQSYTFDFFNYAGIHRSVFLHTTPNIYIEDIIVNTDIQGLTGFVVYNVTYAGYVTPGQEVLCAVELLDRNQTMVAKQVGCAGLLEVANAHFWWPFLMSSDPGYLYTLQVSLSTDAEQITDVYRQKIGIRTVSWSNTTVYINDKPIYMRGFGMHEDSDIRGKGLDLTIFIKNFNLIRWVGANTFRTSHYPYSEELYDIADELGIMIIDECPSVDTDLYSDSLLQKHKDSLTELIKRDKNHPSVIMWSIANEPRTQLRAANDYFGEVAKHVRSMDLSRPITIALARSFSEDQAGQHLDVISFNRYNGWYSSPGILSNIKTNVVNEAKAWHDKYNKPVLMSEYGADTIAGLHLYPEYVWSEEYQVELMSQHFRAFDLLRQEGFFVGEFIWNFADFKTAQTITRVGGNKKGIFTRSRQPKASAHHLRKRYHELAKLTDGADVPTELYSYVSDGKLSVHEEL